MTGKWVEQMCQKVKIVLFMQHQVHNRRQGKDQCFWINASGLFFRFYCKCYFQAVCNFVIACLDYLTSELSHHTWRILNRYVPLFQACCSIFSRNFLKDLLSHASAMFVILIFNICNVYEMISHIHRIEVR